MTWEQPGFKPTGHKAGADLSALQYHWIKGTAAQTVGAIAADTDRPLAVLMDAPANVGDAAELCSSGIVKIVSAGSVTAMDPVGPSADGSATKRTYGTDTTKYVAGTALQDGTVAGDVIPVLLCTPHRAV